MAAFSVAVAGAGSASGHVPTRLVRTLFRIATAGCYAAGMAIRIVRLGTPRAAGEGLRLGTVRRPPRGVPKEEFAQRDFYDVWLPNLAPSAELMAQGRAAQSDSEWAAFKRKYETEMKQPQAVHVLDTLAALSHQTSFAVGCYCENEEHCHRSVLRALLAARGAEIA